MWTCLTLRESFLTMHVDWIHISLIGIVIVSFYVCKAITFAESQENSSICVTWWMGPTGRVKNVWKSLTELAKVDTWGNFDNLFIFLVLIHTLFCSCSEGFNYNEYKSFLPLSGLGRILLSLVLLGDMQFIIKLRCPLCQITTSPLINPINQT